MLRIRLSRTGRKNQPKFRIVVIEHSRSVKGKALEIVGHYIPTQNKEFVFNAERIKHWISKGAKPSDTVASLLKAHGMEGMDVYIIAPRDKKRPKKAELKAEAGVMKKEEKGDVEITLKEDKKKTSEEEQKEKAPAEVKKEETSSKEQKEEAPAEVKKEETSPKEQKEKAPAEVKKEETSSKEQKEEAPAEAKKEEAPAEAKKEETLPSSGKKKEDSLVKEKQETSK